MYLNKATPTMSNSNFLLCIFFCIHNSEFSVSVLCIIAYAMVVYNCLRDRLWIIIDDWKHLDDIQKNKVDGAKARATYSSILLAS